MIKRLDSASVKRDSLDLSVVIVLQGMWGAESHELLASFPILM